MVDSVGFSESRRTDGSISSPNAKGNHGVVLRISLLCVIATGVGEGLGLTVTTALSAMVSGSVGEPQSVGDAVLLHAAMIFAGASEGLILGTAQWMALSLLAPKLRQGRFIAMTSLGMGGAWLVATVASVWEPVNGSDLGVGLWLVSAGFGALVGGCVGIAQAFALRRWISRSVWFVILSAVGWMLGMLTTPVVATRLSSAASTLDWLFGATASGLVVGSVAGAFLAIGLLRLGSWSSEGLLQDLK